MSLFSRLKEESSPFLDRFPQLPFIQAVASGKITKERYMEFLNDLYHVVWHFVPTMSAAASRCTDQYESIRYFFYDHIEEEKEHEKWVLEDCEFIGGQSFADKVKSGLPCYEIQAFNAFNYYQTERVHSTVTLSMVFILEAISARFGGKVGDGIAKSLKLENGQGIKFLSSHGDLDIDHLSELEQYINTIHDPKVCDIISNACAVNFELFMACMK